MGECIDGRVEILCKVFSSTSQKVFVGLLRVLVYTVVANPCMEMIFLASLITISKNMS